jgi:hypothetical protein
MKGRDKSMRTKKSREAQRVEGKKKKVSPVLPPNGEFPDRMMNDEAAAYLRVAPATLMLWRCNGSKTQIPYSKVGGRVIYLKSDLEAFLASTRRTQTA